MEAGEELEPSVTYEREQERPEPSFAARAYTWVLDRVPTSRRGRVVLALLVALLVLVPSLALLLLPIWFDLGESQFANLGYAGVFVANLGSTATVFIPVPGLTATAQALINEQGATLNPLLVGLLGGTGMALGEVTAYAAGAAGSEVAREGQLDVPRFARPVVHRVVRWIDYLMERYGFATLAILSAIPNPTFEIAGITAGAVRMNFWRFMAAVLIGKNVRGLLLAYLGYYGLELLFFT